jgi:hypothetical protein
LLLFKSKYKSIKIKRKANGPYGLHDLIKLHTKLPFFIDAINVQHGWTPLDNVLKSDLENTKGIMLCWNKRYKEQWVKNSNIPCEIIGAPFVHYKRFKNIKISKNAEGTLAFPAHSIKELQADFDIEKYCNELISLPDKYQPVTICLHPLDIEYYNLDKQYAKRGFKVVSAAFHKEKPFYDFFYNTLRQHKYTTSNEPGSYTLYAIEMRIPFFILGDLPVRNNKAFKNKDISNTIVGLTDFKYGKIAYDLFNNSPKDTITIEQSDFVTSELGINDCLDPEKMRKVIIQSLRKKYHEDKKNNVFQMFLNTFKKALRRPRNIIEIVNFYKCILFDSNN